MRPLPRSAPSRPTAPSQSIVPSRPAAPRPGAIALLAIGLLFAAGCSDPGSGGTGVPGTELGTGAPAPVSAPAPAPAPASGGIGDGAACDAPPGATTATFGGRVRAFAGTCLQVDERRIDVVSARVLRRSGAAATTTDLVVGVAVTVEPLPNDPARAATVVVEDVGG